jgi:DNA repair exonuclease SbcCD ATPase subunit
MVDIMTALVTATQAIKLAQDLRGIDKAVDAADYKLKIAELTSALSDLKSALTDAKSELASKDAEIERLSKALHRSAELVEYHGYRYDKMPDGKPKGAPYCPVCEQKGTLIHLAKFNRIIHCPNCNGSFDGHFFGHG